MSNSMDPTSSPHATDSIASVCLSVSDPGLPRSAREVRTSQAFGMDAVLPKPRLSARSTDVSMLVPIVINPGKVPFVPPRPVELYRIMPQTIDLAYKAEATFTNALFF